MVYLQWIMCGWRLSCWSTCCISVFSVAVRMLGYRVNNRRQDVQHEDHRRRQARLEKDCGRTGAPLTQEPRAERRSGGGVDVNFPKRCPATPRTSWNGIYLLRRKDRDRTRGDNRMTALPSLPNKLTRTVWTAHRWTSYELMSSFYF